MLETGLSMSQFMTAIAIADVNIRELRQRVPFCGPLVEVQEYWSTSPGRRADSHVATAHEVVARSAEGSAAQPRRGTTCPR